MLILVCTSLLHLDCCLSCITLSSSRIGLLAQFLCCFSFGSTLTEHVLYLSVVRQRAAGQSVLRRGAVTVEQEDTRSEISVTQRREKRTRQYNCLAQFETEDSMT